MLSLSWWKRRGQWRCKDFLSVLFFFYDHRKLRFFFWLILNPFVKFSLIWKALFCHVFYIQYMFLTIVLEETIMGSRGPVVVEETSKQPIKTYNYISFDQLFLFTTTVILDIQGDSVGICRKSPRRARRARTAGRMRTSRSRRRTRRRTIRRTATAGRSSLPPFSASLSSMVWDTQQASGLSLSWPIWAPEGYAKNIFKYGIDFAEIFVCKVRIFKRVTKFVFLPVCPMYKVMFTHK